MVASRGARDRSKASYQPSYTGLPVQQPQRSQPLSQSPLRPTPSQPSPSWSPPSRLSASPSSPLRPSSHSPSRSPSRSPTHRLPATKRLPGPTHHRSTTSPAKGVALLPPSMWSDTLPSPPPEWKVPTLEFTPPRTPPRWLRPPPDPAATPGQPQASARTWMVMAYREAQAEARRESRKQLVEEKVRRGGGSGLGCGLCRAGGAHLSL